MAHDKTYGICENKCMVEVNSKEEQDAVEAGQDAKITALESDVSALETQLDEKLSISGGTISGNLEVEGTTTFDGNVFMDGSGTPLIIGNNGKIGLRAKGSSIANAGQINISDSWYDGNQWGAQISAYDGVENKYNQMRVSHDGIQYIVYDNATGSETAQQIALTDDIPDVSGKQDTLTAGTNITISGTTISATDTTYSTASTSSAGLMSASDKSKLDGITASADAVSVSRSLTSGTKIGTITINGTGTDLYCETNTDTNTTYSAGTGMSLSGTTFNHRNSVTAKTTYLGSATAVPMIKYDAQGHITAATTTTIYPPTTVGASGQIWTSDGSGAGTWKHKITISTSDPSGGSDGDIWYKYE